MGSKRAKTAEHELQFNVSQLLKEPTGAFRRHEICTALLGKLDGDETVVSPITGHIKFLRTGADVLVTGTLTATVQKDCGRCLSLFSTPLVVELEEQFYPTVDVTTGTALPLPPDADEANEISAQHVLDLLEVVRQAFQLESAGSLYCRRDCKGLCPSCGQDRNITSCDCESPQIDERWAGLRALQIED
jgi:uncharacterized protein